MNFLWKFILQIIAIIAVKDVATFSFRRRMVFKDGRIGETVKASRNKSIGIGISDSSVR